MCSYLEPNPQIRAFSCKVWGVALGATAAIGGIMYGIYRGAISELEACNQAVDPKICSYDVRDVLFESEELCIFTIALIGTLALIIDCSQDSFRRK